MAETYARPDLESRASRRTGSIRAAGWSACSILSPASHVRAVAFLIAVRPAAVPAGLFQHSADRPRRGAVRAGDQADGRDRRFRRHPLPGRRPLQEAGRHLLAAGGRGRNRVGARPAARAAPDLALPGALADRRHRRGAADLLDGAGVRDAARRRAGRADDVQFGAARRRGAARQDRRHAAAHRGRGDGRDGAGLSVLAARRGSRASALDLARDLLDRAGRRHPAQGAADPDVRGADDRHAGDPRPVGEHGCGGCGRYGA